MLPKASSKGCVPNKGRICGRSSPEADENVQLPLPQSSRPPAGTCSKPGQCTAGKAQFVPLSAKHVCHTAGKAARVAPPSFSSMSSSTISNNQPAPYRSIDSGQSAADSALESMAKGANPFARASKQKVSSFCLLLQVILQFPSIPSVVRGLEVGSR